MERYHRTLRAGLAAGADSHGLKSSLFDVLRAKEQSPDRRVALARWGRRQAGPTSSLPDVTLRADVLGSEGRWIEACALVQSPSECSQTVLHRIATHLPADRAEEAAALLLQVFQAIMERSSSPYREALALVGEIGQRMDAARRGAWLGQLRIQYRAKRNFIRDLPSD